MDEYNCRNEKWLQRLYGIREKWCPAFSKDYFSGGILSSQRSESTNHCVSRRLSKSASLCDFYHGFMDVIAEWRSKENYEEFCEKKAVLDMAVANSKLLKHANNVYTFEAYRLFELEYIKFVWCDGVDHFRHTVLYNHHDFSISCSCKMLSEVGIMCCHCLRIFNIHCVQAIPERYILKRWTKDYIQGSIGSALKLKDGNSDEIVASSIWRTQMSRKFSYLISGSEVNKNARFYVEEGFKRMRDEVVSEVGTIYFEESEEDCISDAVIKDPIRKKSKGERNVRRKSIVEVKCNQARWRKKEAAASTSRTKKAVHSSMMQKNSDAVANVVASTSSSFEDGLDFLRS